MSDAEALPGWRCEDCRPTTAAWCSVAAAAP